MTTFLGRILTHEEENQIINDFKSCHKRVEIERNEYGQLVSLDGQKPCMTCGIYHNPFSKASIHCSTKIVSDIISVVNRDECENCQCGCHDE